AAFDGIVEKPVNGVAVVRVVFGGIDAALRSDAVRAAGAVLEAEAFNFVTEFGHGRRSRSAGESAADDNDIEFPLVRRVDKLHVEFVLVPLLRDRAGGNFGIEGHIISTPPFRRTWWRAGSYSSGRIRPARKGELRHSRQR